jgi:hypothetical protein
MLQCTCALFVNEEKLAENLQTANQETQKKTPHPQGRGLACLTANQEVHDKQKKHGVHDKEHVLCCMLTILTKDS